MAQQQEINLQKLAEPSRWSNEGADDPKEGVTWMSAQERLLLYILFLLMEQVLGSKDRFAKQNIRGNIFENDLCCAKYDRHHNDTISLNGWMLTTRTRRWNKAWFGFVI